MTVPASPVVDVSRPESPAVGLVGLAVMGANLARNLARNGVPVVAYNRSRGRTEELLASLAAGVPIKGVYDLAALAAALPRPRRLLLMVKAGAPVDATIEALLPHLQAGDLVIDGGNSRYTDTERRAGLLAPTGVQYMGLGVSGGESGALWGPSLMPGGPRDAYASVQAMLTAVAAQVDGEPCCTYLGPGGAGHFVKMVHNGIEYADMQILAEVYALLGGFVGLSTHGCAEVFARWNSGPLRSYLVEVTAAVLAHRDEETGRPLVELILDRAGAKGTGRWTSEAALELGVPVPCIDAAVQARAVSADKDLRLRIADAVGELSTGAGADGSDGLAAVDALHDAALAARMCAYAQGFQLLLAASRQYGWELPLADIAKIWRGGCILRAALLQPIREALGRDPGREHLLEDPPFAAALGRLRPGLVHAVCEGARHGVAAPALSAALGYLDGLRTRRGPANLIQAQRDFFGAHTYERTDRPGTFHTVWE